VIDHLQVHQQAADAALPSHAEQLERLTDYMIDLETTATAAVGQA